MDASPSSPPAFASSLGSTRNKRTAIIIIIIIIIIVIITIMIIVVSYQLMNEAEYLSIL